MAIKFEKIKPGMRLKQITTTQMGNTTMRRTTVYDVLIKEVVVEPVNEHGVVVRKARVSWNSNRDEWWTHHRLEKLYREDSPAVVKANKREEDSFKMWR